jgi:hypothetical protein
MVNKDYDANLIRNRKPSKGCISLIGALAVSLLCGCGNLAGMPTLTEEQTELVTEYAAGLILKHDESFDDGALLDDEELAKQEAQEALQRERDREAKAAAEDYLAKKANADKSKKDKKDKSEDSNDSSSEESKPSEATVADMAAFYGMDSFSISYKGYILTDSYPTSGEDMLMAMDATSGNQLCVLKFDVTNISGSDATFDMFYRNPNFYLNIDGQPQVHQQYTLLLDDMAASNDAFAAGQSEERVLIFEISDSVSDIGSMSLSARNSEGQKGTMPIQ